METQGWELERCALPHWDGSQILVTFLDEGQLLWVQVGQERGLLLPPTLAGTQSWPAFPFDPSPMQERLSDPKRYPIGRAVLTPSPPPPGAFCNSLPHSSWFCTAASRRAQDKNSKPMTECKSQAFHLRRETALFLSSIWSRKWGGFPRVYTSALQPFAQSAGH